MPERHRRPRRRLDRGVDSDFSSEREVREVVAQLRARYETTAEAEATDEWRALHRRVTRWVLRTATGLPPVRPEDHAHRIALIYLRRPEFLPAPPPQLVEAPE